MLHNDYQVLIRKVANPCPSKHYCSPLGSTHAYLWRERKLVKVPSGSPVELTPDDTEALEQLITARTFGEVGFDTSDPAVAGLVAKLGLDLLGPINPLSATDLASLLGVARP